MKSALKLALIVVLFTVNAFGEGNMGNGGRTCPLGTPTCLVAVEPTQTKETADQSEDSFLILVQDYFYSVFEYFEN